jgi:signal transduction histidine kinase
MEKIEKAPHRKKWQELRKINHQGQEQQFLKSFSAVFEKDNYQGLIVIIADVTEAYRQSIDLAEKSEQLLSANQAKERIISLLTHDLKEGLGSSFELTELVLKDAPNFSKEQLPDYFKLDNQSLHKTKTLLFSTLNWVRSQKDELSAQKEIISLREMVNEAIKNKEDQRREKKINLEIQVVQELKVWADPNIITTVIRNLYANALKISEKESDKVMITAKVLGKQSLELHIIDNGTGLDDEQKERILNRNYLKSTTGTQGERGTGIGLNLCQNLLVKHGSSLEVNSTLDQGSDFHFQLTLA